jgi:hypothetical protein
MSHTDAHHTFTGLLLFILMLGLLGWKYYRSRKHSPVRPRGWVGLAVIFLAEFCLGLHVKWVSIYFTPLVWTGYLLFLDALVESLEGKPRLTRAPGKFLRLAFWSVPLWLVFEAYNLRLASWTYVGLPESRVLRAIGYAWSFATIWPAIYTTADFLRALGLGSDGRRRIVFGPRAQAATLAFGLLFVAAPILLPPRVGSYLFGAVWLGFVLVLDPINHRWGGRSLIGELELGRTSTLYPFLVSGLVCGVLWEFWNYWAAAKWLYVFPIWQNAKLFEMPLPGFLGFPPFALECFVMFEFLRSVEKRLVGFLPPTAGPVTQCGTEAAPTPQ